MYVEKVESIHHASAPDCASLIDRKIVDCTVCETCIRKPQLDRTNLDNTKGYDV